MQKDTAMFCRLIRATVPYSGRIIPTGVLKLTAIAVPPGWATLVARARGLLLWLRIKRAFYLGGDVHWGPGAYIFPFSAGKIFHTEFPFPK